jgi:putative DNA methylase
MVAITRRRLPHWYAVGQPLFVTFRLAGSLPRGRHFDPGEMNSGQAFACLDGLLDRGAAGPLYLRMAEVAGLVEEAIRAGAETDYSLHAWVVMPNHVHLLITPLRDVSEILNRLKGVTARAANRWLGREGERFWQAESYDRLVRDEKEFRRIESYILRNPVKAGLAASVEEYRWSSGWKGWAG